MQDLSALVGRVLIAALFVAGTVQKAVDPAAAQDLALRVADRHDLRAVLTRQCGARGAVRKGLGAQIGAGLTQQSVVVTVDLETVVALDHDAVAGIGHDLTVVVEQRADRKSVV